MNYENSGKFNCENTQLPLHLGEFDILSSFKHFLKLYIFLKHFKLKFICRTHNASLYYINTHSKSNQLSFKQQQIQDVKDIYIYFKGSERSRIILNHIIISYLRSCAFQFLSWCSQKAKVEKTEELA